MPSTGGLDFPACKRIVLKKEFGDLLFLLTVWGIQNKPIFLIKKKRIIYHTWQYFWYPYYGLNNPNGQERAITFPASIC